MATISVKQFKNFMKLLSTRELFQVEKLIKDLFAAEVGAEVLHPPWQSGSVVMYYDLEESVMCSGIIRRIDRVVVTVQNRTTHYSGENPSRGYFEIGFA